MAGFGADVLDDIRARVDIVELVGQFVNLKRAVCVVPSSSSSSRS